MVNQSDQHTHIITGTLPQGEGGTQQEQRYLTTDPGFYRLMRLASLAGELSPHYVRHTPTPHHQDSQEIPTARGAPSGRGGARSKADASGRCFARPQLWRTPEAPNRPSPLPNPTPHPSSASHLVTTSWMPMLRIQQGVAFWDRGKGLFVFPACNAD